MPTPRQSGLALRPPACLAQLMAAPKLCDLWLAAPEGKLCAREQAKAWALREAWRAEGKGAYGLLAFVAARVNITRNGKPAGACPTTASMHEFFAKVDADAEWFPGKQTGGPRGPKRVLRGPREAPSLPPRSG